jgi:hypothetical protein
VFLDGQKVPDSTIAPVNVNPGRTTALIDTVGLPLCTYILFWLIYFFSSQGNSLIRGPEDMVDNILKAVSPTYQPGGDVEATLPCAVPRTMAFQIGGKVCFYLRMLTAIMTTVFFLDVSCRPTRFHWPYYPKRRYDLCSGQPCHYRSTALRSIVQLEFGRSIHEIVIPSFSSAETPF